MNNFYNSSEVAERYTKRDGVKGGFLRQHSLLLVRLCSLMDSFVIFVTLIWVIWLYEGAWQPQHLIAGLIAALLFQIIATFFDLYRSWRVVRFRFEVIKIFLILTAAIVFSVFVHFVSGSQHAINNIAVLTWYLSAFLVMAAVHYTARLITRYARALGYDVRRVAFIGATDVTLRMTRIYADHPWMGMENIGIYDNRKRDVEDHTRAGSIELAGTADDLIELARDCAVDIVYVCLPMNAEKRIKYYIDSFADTTVSIYYCPNFFNFDLMQSRWDEVFGQPVISIVESPFVDHQRYLKRLEDLVIVLALFPILVPLMLVISALVKMTSPGPVFFKQNRYGINGGSFRMWKFRTMYVDKCDEPYSQVTRNDPRITPLGAFLRKTSLDEIPQFLNVLAGDMSVVGPRPHPDEVNEDLRKRIHRYMLRHKVKPGITGLAQVSGLRGETESLDKMSLRIEQDLQYIRQWSLMLDVKILFKTLFHLRGSNVY